jgi:hypothetical protein
VGEHQWNIVQLWLDCIAVAAPCLGSLTCRTAGCCSCSSFCCLGTQQAAYLLHVPVLHCAGNLMESIQLLAWKKVLLIALRCTDSNLSSNIYLQATS